MTRAVPWNVKGVDFDAREAAEAAARRAGMSLGEWLNSIIAEQAAELGLTAEDIDDDQRLEAVAARLATLSKRPEQNVSHGVRPSDRDNREAARRALPHEAEFAELRRARAVHDEVDRRAPAPADPELLLDRAIAAFDRRARLANDRTSAALATVSQRLAEIEGRLDHGSQLHGAAPAKEVLSRLAAIAGRLEQAEAKTPVGGRPEDLTRIEAKLNRLSETIDRAARPQPHPGPHRGPLGRRSVADAVAEITQRQMVLDHDARPAPAPGHLGSLQADLAALSVRLEEMGRDIEARDEQQFRMIGEKIEALGAARPDAAALAHIRAQTEEIRDLLAAAVAQPMPIENIDRQITALAERVEAIATRGPSPLAYAQCNANLAEIRAALERPVADALLQQIEGRIEALTQKVEEALSDSAGSEHFDELRQRLDFIHQSLAARIERPAPPLDTTAFEAMMREIVGKLDQPPPAAVNVPRLENLMSRLADRLEAPAETRRLEELVADLADKIDVAAKPHADLPALNALQDQIERLARRLDDADANAGAFGSLERSIADLFAGLEETRRAAVEAAETAARTAARDAMREVALSPAAGLRPATDEQADNVRRELADLRALQDTADRQTHATLTAVHETLERVVDRLAMLEDDIIDVRGAASEQPSAAGPPPLFASSPRPGHAPPTPRANFPDFTPTPPRRSEPSHAQDGPPAPRFDDRDFLIEPGTGFSPERRGGEPERRATNAPPRPPGSPDSKPPAAPPSTPSAPPPAGSTQANFIAAARRTIQANAMESAEASSNPGRVAAVLDGALAEARSRARAAAAALMDDHAKRADEAQPERRPGGALARASAFFSTRKRPLVLGLAGIVVALCALELVRSQASPPVVVVDDTGVPAPSRTAPARLADPSSNAQFTPGPSAPTPSVEPTTTGSAHQTEAAPAKSSSLVAPDIDLSPVGSIATPAAAPAADSGADDLAAVRDLAGSGDAAAEYELGLRYAEGRSVPRNLTLAAQWLEKAAKQNNAPAQYRLATLYEKGLGVAHDTAVALDWYQRAATAGNIRAMHNLAVLVAEGTDGKPDYDDAAIWFRKAAEFGVGDSQYNLAILYARGLGVQKDLQQSYIWFALAAAQGDEDAGKKRDEVATHLDPKQLADAKAIIDGFTPRKALASANNVAPPPGGWGTSRATPGRDAKPAPGGKPGPGAKVSTL
jgi:localization factor PodJL